MPEAATSAAVRPSLKARTLHLLLRLMRRKRIYASAAALHAGIAQTRQAGPAPLPETLRRQMRVQQEQLLGCEVSTLGPLAGGAPRQRMLYLHGGAYCRPIHQRHWLFINWLVTGLGSAVMVPLYPLAPESSCRQTVEVMVAIYREFVRRHGAPSCLMGDSAGAGLSLATCLALREAHVPLPDKLVLLTPWTDVATAQPGLHAAERLDPMLAVAGLREAGRLYAGGLGLQHPWVSPVHGDLRGLPPMQVVLGSHDLLYQDGLALVNKARADGVQVSLHTGQGMVHVWPLLPIPEAMRLREHIRAFVQTEYVGGQARQAP